jgi:ketosteroid isomerase-like protein
MTPEEKAALAEVAMRTEAPRTTLEERLTLAEDKEAIRDVIAAYGFLCDSANWDELLELYTDDVERVLTGSLEEHVQGKEALRQLYLHPVLPVKSGGGDPKERLDASVTEGRLSARHLISHHVTRVSDDGAEAWSAVQYSLVLEREGDEYERGVHEGAYLFWFLKQGGRWRVRKLTVIANSARNPLNRRKAMA